MEALQINDTLTYLDLSNNSITSEGAQYLNQIIEQSDILKELILHRNSLKDAGWYIFFLIMIAHFSFLYLPSSATVAQALLTNTSLEVIDLSDNVIERRGIQSLCMCLMSNNSVRQVILRRNVIDVAAEIKLMELILHKGIEILWRSQRTKDDALTKSETDQIIEHFTPQKVFQKLLLPFGSIQFN